MPEQNNNLPGFINFLMAHKALIIVGLAFLIEILKEWKKIFTRDAEWQHILLVFLLVGSSIVIFLDSEENSKRVTELASGNATLRAKIDTMNKSFEESLKRTADSMSYQFGKGIGASIANSDTNKFQILTDALSNKKELLCQIDSLNKKLDSSDKYFPDLNILRSNHQAYKMIQDSSGWKLVFALENDGNGRAYEIKFTASRIRKVNSALGNQDFLIEQEQNLFGTTQKEIAPNGAISANSLIIPDETLLENDTTYYVLEVYYRSYTHRRYHLKELFRYVFHTGEFQEFISAANPPLNQFLKSRGLLDL